MNTTRGRYSVRDETEVRDESEPAPNGDKATANSSGAGERFDDAREAIRFARDVWDRSEQRHRIVVRDRENGNKVVWAGDEIITTPLATL